MMALPPQYLRSAVFVNNSDKAVSVEIAHKSGEQQVVSIDAGAKLDVEKTIDKGSWQEVDAIEGILVKAGGSDDQTVDLQVGGVERHQYTIALAEGGLAVEKLKL
mmetsp:Transcript_1812/g.1256  ORF Transcript_1812/g.1256 Transcript_1812/m.1256 type:complete len:105 (-) Transcript_1812:87-401(-)